jgi:hypothetical protein
MSFQDIPYARATIAPQTPRRLLAVGPDMAKILPVVALCKANLGSVYLYLDKVMRNRGRDSTWVLPFGSL